MKTNNHPAHGPVSLDRLHQIRQYIERNNQYQNGGNRAYILADVLKVIDGAIAEFEEQDNPRPVMAVKGELGFIDNLEKIIEERDEDIDIGQLGSSNYDALMLAALDAFRASLPATVVPEEMFNNIDNHYGDEDLIYEQGKIEGWNACRAAMLQAGNHTKQHLDMVDHSGDDNEKADCKLPFDQWLSQQNEPIDVDCGCVTTEAFYHWLRVAYEAGNSPVTQDGSERFANSVERFGKFSAGFGEGGEIELSITLFHFGNGNIPEDKRKSTTPKFMFQGVINQLQKKCDEMTDEPLINLTELWFGDESKG